MRVSEAILWFDALAVATLASWGLLVMYLERPNFRLARRLFWLSAGGMGVFAMVWNVTAFQSPWIRITVTAVFGAFIAVGLGEALRWTYIHERAGTTPAAPNAQIVKSLMTHRSSDASANGTPSTSPRKSKTELKIEELKTQAELERQRRLARKLEARVTPAPRISDIQSYSRLSTSDDDLVRATGSYFPSGYPKNTIYAGLTNNDLKREAHHIAAQLRVFEAMYRKQIAVLSHQPPADDAASVQAAQAKLQELQDQTIKTFQTTLLISARNLHFELLNRMNLPFPTSTRSGLTIQGYQAIMSGEIYSTSALGNFADYLDDLANRLN
jgi:hypothetical protein